MIESAAGVSIAAPTPCSAREVTSIPEEPASPLISDAAVKSSRPAKNT